MRAITKRERILAICLLALGVAFAYQRVIGPQPPVVDPGGPGKPPSDAVVLFDGRDLSQWTNAKGAAAGWRVNDGYMEVVKNTGAIRTKRGFGDCQLHVEWATPSPGIGSGQDRGNSGVFLMDIYEVQVLDSYNNKTYADGSAAAIVASPLVFPLWEM